jgi:hypothetical protein
MMPDPGNPEPEVSSINLFVLLCSCCLRVHSSIFIALCFFLNLHHLHFF